MILYLYKHLSLRKSLLSFYVRTSVFEVSKCDNVVI